MKKNDLEMGYTVEPAANGGWMVKSNVMRDDHMLPLVLAAFTDYMGLCDWLRDEHIDIERIRDERKKGEKE